MNRAFCCTKGRNWWLFPFLFARDFGNRCALKFSLPPKARYGIAIVAGLFLALSFPKPGVAGLAWLAPGLMLFAALGRRGRECFRIGYIAGLTHYLVTLYWLLFIPFPAGAVVGWLALSAYLALYPAAWVWLCWKLFPVAAIYDYRTSQADSPTVHRTPLQFDELLATNWWQRAWWTVLCAALWVASEMVVARFLSGFPWSLLGVSQYSIVLLIQIASVTGVYGVSFLVVWSSVSLAVALLRIVRQPGLRWGWLLELRLTLIALMGVMIFGIHRLRQRAEAAVVSQ